jgi:hypothetical protein
MSKSKTQLKKLSKEQLEAYGRTIGIELDRRLVKKTLIEQLIEHQASDNVEHTHDDGMTHTHPAGDVEHSHSEEVEHTHDNGVTHTHSAGDVEHSHATDEKETVKIKKVLDKVVEKVAAVTTKVVGKTKGHVLLRDKSTGAWSSGPKPKGSQTGTSRGEPFWEV